MNRAQRRALDARADRAFARARGSLLAYVDSTADLAVLDEHGTIEILPAALVSPTLAALGVSELVAEIEAHRDGHAFGWLPVAVIIDGHVSVRWAETHPLCRGGAA